MGHEPEKIETSLYEADGKPVRLDFSDLLEGENGDLTFTYSSKNGNRYWNAMKPDAEGLATPTGSDNRFVHITDDEDKVLWMGEFAEHDEESAAEGPYVSSCRRCCGSNLSKTRWMWSFPEGTKTN